MVFATVMARAEPNQGVLVQAEAQSLTPFCAGRDVRIEGNHNTVTLIGVCRSLLLKGVGNAVSLDLGKGASIRVEGSANHIAYRAPAAPDIQVLGQDITVTADEPAAPAGVALTLDGSDRALATGCAGRDVIISGDRALYLLRGGCRSLTVHGDLVTVQAEMQPGAAISVMGHGSRVGWGLAGPGQPPVALVHGAASRIGRLGEIGGLLAR